MSSSASCMRSRRLTPRLRSNWLLNVPTLTNPPFWAVEQAPNLSAGLKRKVNWSGTGTVGGRVFCGPEALSASGERLTRTMAARAIGKVGSIVITCSSVLHNQFCIFSTVAKDCDVQVQLYTFILAKIRWTLASETTKLLVVLITE